MSSFESLTKSQKLRASLHRDVMAICKETCQLLGTEMTKPAMEVIAELLYKKIAIYARDLEAFAKHAKRSTINAEDVKLLVRRNPSLKAHLNAMSVNQPSTSKEKKRKTYASTAAIETPLVKLTTDAVSEKTVNNKNQSVNLEMEIENIPLEDTIDLTFD